MQNIDKTGRNLKKDIEEAMNRIEKMDANKIDYSELNGQIDIILDRFAIASPYLQPNYIFYRGIKYSNKPNYYQGIIYPPVNKARMNRANDNGEQMFYCSTMKKSVLYELGVKPGDTVVISTWMNTRQLLLNNIGFTEVNLRRLGANDVTPLFKEGISDLDDELNQKINEFFGKIFTKISDDQSYYTITNAIAKRFMSDIAGTSKDFPNSFDGLCYPTIRLNGDSINVALKPHVIDCGILTLDRVEFIEILEECNGIYFYRIKDISNSLNGDSIEWESLANTWTVNDEMDDLYFVDGVAYNESGEIIPSDNSNKD